MQRSLRLVVLLLVLPSGTARAQPAARDGEARLLRFPAIHGKQIVFTYAGDLYTVPSEGGVARRLTDHDGFEMFARFSPDGKWLAFTGQYDGNTEVYRMSAEGGKPIRLTYTATLGRDDVSDRMGPNNIVMGWTPKGTHVVFRSRMRSFNDFIGQLYIVFENGGWVYRFDLQTEKAEKVPVRILEDRSAGRPELVDVSKKVTNYEISPDGKRALFGARGDVFTVPAEHGPTRNLTKTSGVHERNSKWSPDGKWVAFISDKSGEDEVWIAPQDGRGETKQLTTGGDTYKYDLLWSPDSKNIAWTDRMQRLQYVDVESKKVTPVVQAKAFEVREFAWSPDSKWIAYAKPETDAMTNVYLKDGRAGPARRSLRRSGHPNPNTQRPRVRPPQARYDRDQAKG